MGNIGNNKSSDGRRRDDRSEDSHGVPNNREDVARGEGEERILNNNAVNNEDERNNNVAAVANIVDLISISDDENGLRQIRGKNKRLLATASATRKNEGDNGDSRGGSDSSSFGSTPPSGRKRMSLSSSITASSTLAVMEGRKKEPEESKRSSSLGAIALSSAVLSSRKNGGKDSNDRDGVNSNKKDYGIKKSTIDTGKHYGGINKHRRRSSWDLEIRKNKEGGERPQQQGSNTTTTTSTTKKRTSTSTSAAAALLMKDNRGNDGYSNAYSSKSIVNNNGPFSNGPSSLTKYLGSLGRDGRRALFLDAF